LIAFSASCWQAIELGLFRSSDRFFGSAAMRKIPSHDFSRCSSQSHSPDRRNPLPARPRSWSCPTARSDSVALLPRGPTLSSVGRASVASEPANFAHASPSTLASDSRKGLPAQPPNHTAITVSWFFSAGLNDLFVPLPIGSTHSRLLPVVQTRSADDQCRSHYRRRVSRFDQRSRLGVNGPAAHSPHDVFLGFQFPGIYARDFVPVAGFGDPSRFLPRQRFSPQALPLLLVPLHPSNGSRASERSRASYKFQRRSRSSVLPAQSAISLPRFDLRVVSCPCCLLFGGPESYRIRQSSFSGEHYRTFFFPQLSQAKTTFLALLLQHFLEQ
jgi:hypothetical protein